MTQILLLLAEDEALVRISTQAVLESGGFGVITASSGNEALSLLEEEHQELSGLVTDIRLGPGPDGWELAHRARELNPLIAVVYTTGDSAAEWAASGVPNSTILQKPFADAQLITAISNSLNHVSAMPAPPPAPEDQ